MIRLLLPVAILVIVAVCVWYFGFHQPNNKQKMDKKPAVPLDDQLPGSGGAIEMERSAPSGDMRKDFWLDLRNLLDGKAEGEAEKLGKDGIFSHRAGLLFAVFHGDGVCVIVKADTATAADVTRIIIDMTKPVVVSIVEPRKSPEGKSRGIHGDMARNTSTDGTAEHPTAEIGFLGAELSRAPRIAPL